MCQAKDKGGKRCSVHQAGSKFSMRVAKLKTGADDATVKETFTELTKEGRPLPTPSKEEVESFIEKKRFATELDPELDDHERKIELSQLARAEKELDSVTGASFHAWKNLRKRVAEKMKAFANAVKKPALALGLAGVVLFGAAGCGQQDNTTSPTAAPTPPVATETATPAPESYGDLIPGEKVTDQYGEYTHVTISPEDDSVTDSSKINSATVAAAGFTPEDAASAQQWTAKFAAEQILDSEALDNDAGWNNWINTKADSYIDPNQKALLLAPLGDSDRSGIIVNNPSNSYPVMVRDGSPRVTTGEVTLNSIDGYTEDGVNYMKVVGNAKATYEFTDEAALNLFRGQGYTDDVIAQTYPQYFEEGNNTMNVNADFTYFLTKSASGSWQIAGYKMAQTN